MEGSYDYIQYYFGGMHFHSSGLVVDLFQSMWPNPISASWTYMGNFKFARNDVAAVG